MKGNAKELLEQCKLSDTLALLIQPSVQTTARTDPSDPQTSATSEPLFSVEGNILGIPLETPSYDNYTTTVGNAGFDVQCFSHLGTEMVLEAPTFLQANGSSDLTLELEVAHATDLCGMPVETPTLDRHVPAMHVSCRAADTFVFLEQSSEQPVHRSWLANDPLTLSGELLMPDMNSMCGTFASDLPTEFCSAPIDPELSMKFVELNNLCGMPLETPTLDRRYAPAIAIRGNSDEPRGGLKLSLADYLL